MQFLGGKHRQAKTIVEHIARYTDRRLLIEPFCGACNVTAEAAKQGFEVRASDAHPALIAMWRALQDGWRPSETDISEAEYQAAKSLSDEDPLKSLIGFGRSFGAKYFGGYARDNPPKPPQDFWGAATRGVARKIEQIGQHALFQHSDFDSIEVPDNAVVYCDPPYQATTGYKTTATFGHQKFWDWCRTMSERCPVFVTEFTVPDDAIAIHEFARKTQLDGVSGKAKTINIERLVVLDNR